MVIPIPERIASQGPPTTTGDDHLWWESGESLWYHRGGPKFRMVPKQNLTIFIFINYRSQFYFTGILSF